MTGAPHPAIWIEVGTIQISKIHKRFSKDFIKIIQRSSLDSLKILSRYFKNFKDLSKILTDPPKILKDPLSFSYDVYKRRPFLVSSLHGILRASYCFVWCYHLMLVAESSLNWKVCGWHEPHEVVNIVFDMKPRGTML